MIIFNYETNECLETWIRDWEKLLEEKPENLILSINFRNMVIHSNKLLLENKKGGLFNYSKSYIQNIINNNSPEINILKDYLGTDNIRKFQSGRDDEKKQILADMAGKLSGKPYLSFLIERLELELFKKVEYEPNTLIALSELIITEAMTKYSPKELKKIPVNVFSNEYTNLIIKRKESEFLRNSNLEVEFYATIKYLINEIDIDIELKKFWADTEPSFLEKIPKNYWKQEVYVFLDRVRDLLIELGQEVMLTKTSIDEEGLYKNEKIFNKFRHLHLEFIGISITEIIRNKIETLLKKRECTQILKFTDFLCESIDSGEFVNLFRKSQVKDISECKGKNNPAVRRVIENFLPIILGEVTAQMIIDKVDVEEINQPSTNFMKFLLNELIQINLTDDLEIKEKCEKIIYNRIKRKQLGACLTDGLDKLSIQPIINKIIDKEISYLYWNYFSDTFLNKFVQFFGGFGLSTGFGNLPWYRLEKDELKFILNKFLEKLYPDDVEWSIVYVIDNISPERQIWKIGTIDFYDPAVWDFGEGFIFDSISKNENGNQAYARVVVKSGTEYMANQIGLLQLKKAIDLMTFIHSVRDKFGINLFIEKKTFVKLHGKGIGGSYSAPISAFADNNKAIQNKIIEKSQIYSNLLERENTSPKTITELQSNFFKSAAWYGKGRWTGDYIHAFLDYWIALEYILAEGKESKLETLLNRLPSFHISWRNVSRSWVLRQYLRQIMIFIKQDTDFKTRINNDTDLIGWDKHDYVLFDPNNLRKIIDYTNKIEVRSYIRRFIDEELTPDQIAGYKEITRLMREQFQFKIYLLYSLRNDIVHGALDYYPNIELYFKVIKEIMEESLIKIFNESIDSSSKCKTLDDLIEDLEKPW